VHDPGVIEEHVEPAELPLGEGDHGRAVGGPRDIGVDVGGPPARAPHQLDGLPPAFVVDVDGGDGRALAREEERRFAADAAARPGDQSDFVL
jgi:hypothetical protein